jgi:membrane associated rhomboid family serine protease
VIPLKDNIPTARFPVVTVVLIAINLLFFVWQLTFPSDPQLDQLGYSSVDQSNVEYGAIPFRVTEPTDEDCAVGAVGDPVDHEYSPGVVCPGTPEYDRAVRIGESSPGSNLDPIPVDQAAWFVTLFTSMFMHGGLLHIGFNMLFLWVFGNNIEDAMGKLKFALFYLAAGLVAVYSHAALDPESTVPVIGASGAVAGVLGAYALLHPRAGVLSLIFIPFLVTLVEVPAWLWIGFWFLLQVVGQFVFPALGGGEDVAYFAHFGGFIFGLATVKLLVRGRSGPDPAVAA